MGGHGTQRDRGHRGRIELYDEHIREREPDGRELALRRATHEFQERARRERDERGVGRERRDRLEQVAERLPEN